MNKHLRYGGRQPSRHDDPSRGRMEGLNRVKLVRRKGNCHKKKQEHAREIWCVGQAADKKQNIMMRGRGIFYGGDVMEVNCNEQEVCVTVQHCLLGHIIYVSVMCVNTVHV